MALTRPRLLLLVGIVLLIIGVWIGATEVYTLVSPNHSPDPASPDYWGPTYCGSPIHPYHAPLDPAGCNVAMGNKQLYTWTLIGGGILVLLLRIRKTQKSPPTARPSSA